MPTPNHGYIKLNSATGNDTTASGCGVNNVSGFGAMWNSSSTTINLMGGSNSGMTVGDVLWIDAGGGQRQFFEIAALPSSQTITTVEQTTNSRQGVSFAVGGTRQTLNGIESLLTYPFASGLTAFELEDNQTAQWNTSSVPSGSYFAFKSDSVTARRAITHTGGNSFFLPPGGRYCCENLIFIPGFASGMTLTEYNTAANGLGGSTTINAFGCNIGSTSSSYDSIANVSPLASTSLKLHCTNCAVFDSPIKLKTSVYANNSFFYSTGEIFTPYNQGWMASISDFHNCIFDTVRFTGILIASAMQDMLDSVTITNSVLTGGLFFNNYFGGVFASTDVAQRWTNNVMVDLTTGLSLPSNMSRTKYFNVAAQINDTYKPEQLASQPFVNVGTQDFNLAASGQGAIDLRDVFGTTHLNTQLYDYRYLLDQLPSGGGNVILIEDN